MPKPAIAPSAATRSYAWRALDSGGRRCRGQLVAADPLQAYLRLRELGLAPLQLRRSWQRPQRLAPAARALLYRQLGALLAAGLPLLQALSSQRDGAAGACCAALAWQLGAGDTLAAAMRRQPRDFPPWDCALIAAAELGGKLDAGLLHLAELCESQLALRAKVGAAMRYPLLVLAVGAAVFAFIMLAVVPTFETMAAQAAVELPAPTRLLLRLSQLLRQPLAWLTALPLLGALVAAAPRALGTLPPLAGIERLRALSVWCRLLASLCEAGLPLLDALQELATAAPLGALAGVSVRLRARVAGGASLTQALHLEPDLPALLSQLLACGEQSGRLDVMLERAAAVFQQQLERRVERLTAWLEPMLLLLLGAGSALLLAAFYGPLLRLGQGYA